MPTIRTDEFLEVRGASGEHALAGMWADLVTNDPALGPKCSAAITATNKGIWIVERRGGNWGYGQFYDYGKISLLEYSNGWINVKVSFFGGDCKYATTNPAGAPDAFVDAVRPRMETARRSKPKESKSKSSEQKEIFEAISRLGELRDSGALTSDEFAAKKTELLDRL